MNNAAAMKRAPIELRKILDRTDEYSEFPPDTEGALDRTGSIYICAVQSHAFEIALDGPAFLGAKEGTYAGKDRADCARPE